MSGEEHLIYFSSKFSSQDPITGSFSVNLPSRLELRGKWKCAIVDFFIRQDNSKFVPIIHLLSDFCSTSFVGEDKLPILSKVYLQKSSKHYNISNLLYIPLKQNILTSFRLSFLDHNLKPILFSKPYLLECTLHFIEV